MRCGRVKDAEAKVSDHQGGTNMESFVWHLKDKYVSRAHGEGSQRSSEHFHRIVCYVILWLFSSFFLLSRGFSGGGSAELGNKYDVYSRQILRCCLCEKDGSGKKRDREIQNSLARFD